MKFPLSERNIIILISCVQFVNVLDFMMVMPLGPDFAEALGIPASEVGIIGGSYTVAAAISGLIASTFLDRFDRKTALLWTLSGLVLGTLAGGLSFDLPSLLCTRVFAGMFGGPASALSLAIISDAIPVERRGRAMGMVMGAFSIASVLGVPAGLELAHWGNWKTPFFALGSAGVLTAFLISKMLPSMQEHLKNEKRRRSKFPLNNLMRQPKVVLTYLMTSTHMTAAFLIIPNIATFVQLNLGFPRENMGLLYMAGGIVSFFIMRLAGFLSDRRGSIFTSFIGTAALIFVFYFGFFHHAAFMPAAMIYVVFMCGMSFRNVAYQTFSTQIPDAGERAGFLSIQSTVQHLSCSIGAFLSSHFLYQTLDGSLGGIQEMAVASMLLVMCMPFLMIFAKRAAEKKLLV